MPLIETKGAASAQGFGGAGAGASGPVTYIEDVFSTWLYTGNSSTQTITNGIDLAGKGGLVWTKSRGAVRNHSLRDTVRGRTNGLSSNLTDANLSWVGLDSFNSNGYTLGDDGVSGTNSQAGTLNNSGVTYVSWTFREQPKFFDVVTYTGNGASNRQISHNLGSVPGCIIVKCTSDNFTNWAIYHTSLGANNGLEFTTAAQQVGYGRWANTSPTATNFTVANFSETNLNGSTYVAYLFAHNAGGFGLSGTDNVISCGSYTGNGLTDGPVINLSYEPQWVMIKRTDSTGNWALIDIMRGFPNTGSAGNYDNGLLANTSGAETTTSLRVKPTSTGFSPVGGDADTNASGGTYIYIAIRRGPMKVPTSGTSVFGIDTFTGTNSTTTRTGYAFSPDMTISRDVGSASVSNNFVLDRLRGWAGASQATINTNSSSAEVSSSGRPDGTVVSKGIQLYGHSGGNNWFVYFARAPGFFDVVCYTGTGSAQTLSHNLGVTPELMIVKWRTGATGDNWNVYHSAIGATGALYLNKTDATVGTAWNNTAPTATQFTVGTQGSVSAATYVAYLFATCAGVSKVGSYTGTGALQTINCGFTGGARFVLIKRTDSTGDWYVWDSARGIVAGSDPYLTLNTTAAEVTTTDWVDTYSAGFELSNAGGNNVNINGATYIFLSVA